MMYSSNLYDHSSRFNMSLFYIYLDTFWNISIKLLIALTDLCVCVRGRERSHCWIREFCFQQISQGKQSERKLVISHLMSTCGSPDATTIFRHMTQTFFTHHQQSDQKNTQNTQKSFFDVWNFFSVLPWRLWNLITTPVTQNENAYMIIKIKYL